MATLSASRTPLGGLDDTRLWTLVNKKNMQNGTSPNPASLKRHREIDSDPAFDPENMDPATLSPKKAKTGASSFNKPQHFLLTSTASGPALTPTTRQLITPKRMQKKVDKITPVSFSAPAAAPAGRSPTKSTKRAGILRKKRSYTPVDPPKFSLSDSSPFSLDAALSGSLGNKPKSARSNSKSKICSLEEPMPNDWFFQIHEDTPEELSGIIIQHSTSILDISDDDEKSRREPDGLGKENVPPPGYAGPGPARRDFMTDDARLPLGMLEAAEFYSAGTDGNSFVVVVDEDDDEKKPSNASLSKASSTDCLADSSPDSVSTGQDVWREILSKVEQKTVEPTASLPSTGMITAGDAKLDVQSSQEPPIEIWESDSAFGDEGDLPEVITSTTPLLESIAAAEAREDDALMANCEAGLDIAS